MRANEHMLTNENHPFGAFTWEFNSKLFFWVLPFFPRSWKIKWWIGLCIAYFQWHFLEVKLKIRLPMQRFVDSREWSWDKGLGIFFLHCLNGVVFLFLFFYFSVSELWMCMAWLNKYWRWLYLRIVWENRIRSQRKLYSLYTLWLIEFH